MSNKRQATTNLNHENWDQDDPSEQEEMGTFASASKDVLEKRVIRTAKRRTQPQASGDEAKKSVFSGFGGFNKTQPSSFDFLSNLTNGNKPSNGSPISKNENAPTGLFSSKPATSSPNASLFSIPMTSSPTTKPIFGIPSMQSSMFGGSPVNVTTTQSPFAAKIATVDSPFKIQTSPNTTDGKTDTFKNTFGTSSSNTSNSLFSTTNTNSSPFKMTTTVTATPKNNSEKKSEEVKVDHKMNYYAKLKGLNESVSDWIKKHVEETPLCLLSPIFKDYEKYLKEIQDEYEEAKKSSEKVTSDTKSEAAKTPLDTFRSSSGSSPLSSKLEKSSMFIAQGNANTSGEKSSGFSFGLNTSTNSSETTTGGGFSFGSSTMTSTTANTNTPFSLAGNAAGAGPNSGAQFSFGTGKPFSFSSNIHQSQDTAGAEANDEEDAPPKVEFTPIVEENSIFDKRVKIFVKKDDNFVDKGVGTLYIKKVENSDKHQLLVRANTNLGNILLNLMLTSGIPTQRLGKNNVMMICIPTPDAKPPPISVLIRVKNSEEADDLLDTLNKYKA